MKPKVHFTDKDIWRGIILFAILLLLASICVAGDCEINLYIGGCGDTTYDFGITVFGCDSVTWSSSNEAIATVDQNGLVTAVDIGTVTITATCDEDGECLDTAIVNVNPCPTLTPTQTATPTQTPTATYTQTATNTATATPTATATATATATPSLTLTQTPSPTSTPSQTLTPTLSAIPTLTQTPPVFYTYLEGREDDYVEIDGNNDATQLQGNNDDYIELEGFWR